MRVYMEDKDFYWLVGILEGEGSFLKATSSMRTCKIVVAMTDKDVIEKVSKLFGGTAISEIDRKPGKWKICYRCSICGRKAVDLAKSIFPYMGIRRQDQITKMINSWNPNGLSKEIVLAIRYEVNKKDKTQAEIAQIFRVKQQTVSDIKLNKFYSWVA